MATRFSRYLDGIIEACWLIVVIVVPLFFNVFSSRIFEPDKVAILRTFSWIILGAWLIKLIDTGGLRWDRSKLNIEGLKSFLKIPLVMPVVLLGFVYLLATILSVSPRISFLGSYQRMQGTYTFLSYLVVFSAIAANLRSKSQINRLINVIIVTSLPIALYGILQRYGLDPVPWEGKVDVRIASTMGNSIFVAAYIIMVVPLTIVRIVEHFRRILKDEENLISHMIRASGYVFILILQVSALYLSQSRGPAMGWIASLLFLGFLFVYTTRKKWVLVGFVVVAIIGVIFLAVFNIEGGPLEQLRNSPVVGRFGRLLDPESNSALVRRYIWEGTTNLVSPHEPLQYPDGSKDVLNILRPIIGYGPETMFVVFNPFYVPELGLVEKRNASPDRSHNETWDSMVTGGLIGLIAYLGVFVSIFYYGYKWLGLVYHPQDKKYFFGLLSLGATFGIVGMYIWRGISYIGIGLPFGIVIGLFMYLMFAVFRTRGDDSELHKMSVNFWLLATLLATTLAHFIEINFGIATVATRTYFWVFAGLLFVVGYVSPAQLIGNGEKDLGETSGANIRNGSGRPKRGRFSRNSSRDYSPNTMERLVAGLLLGVILATLGYDLIGNPDGLSGTFDILWNSITRLESGQSLGILIMLLATWIVSGILLGLGIPESQSRGAVGLVEYLKDVGVVLGTSLFVGVLFWIWHSFGLAQIAQNVASNLDELMYQVGLYENAFVKYLVYVSLLGIAIGVGLGYKRAFERKNETNIHLRGIFATVIIFIIGMMVINLTNIRMIQADIAFRVAGSFSKPGQWPVAVEIIKRVQDYAPQEDHYYLSLAGAYFEQAKAIEEPVMREELLRNVEEDLLTAQELNPLNTDHTANLARLYNLWASYETDVSKQQSLLEMASDYYLVATTLSPQNTRLWGEWSVLFMAGFRQPEKGKELLEHALDVDPNYDWTHGLLAEYYSRSARSTDDIEERRELLEYAAAEYEAAIDRVKYYEAQYKPGYVLALAGVYAQLDEYDRAIEQYEFAIEKGYSQERWRINEALAKLYMLKGDPNSALLHANQALSTAPEDYREQLLLLVAQIKEVNE